MRKFAALAAERIRERPLRYYVVLPLWRVADMWVWPRTERFPVNIWWWDVSDHPGESAIAIGLGLVNLAYLALAVVGFRTAKSAARRRCCWHISCCDAFCWRRWKILSSATR